ncbi:MAG: gamma-glutamyl-gamma-aminobutyrate hydrolase family protein [Gemmatimonadaceae bacterium]
MERRPVIGVTTQTLQAIEGIPQGLPPSWVMSQRYMLALTAVGALPWMIPLLPDDPETLRAIYDRLDGLFLPGGVDMDPAAYGEERHPLCGRTDPQRDRVELALARWAMDDGMPVLGVCRGIQVINVACGGTLFQDVGAQLPRAVKHDYYPTQGFSRDHLAHEVTVLERSRLRDIFRDSTIRVNSMHHQGVKVPAPVLQPCGFAPDGLIEAVELPGDRFVIGVQWHPEALDERDVGTRRLFAAFADAAGAYHDARSEASDTAGSGNCGGTADLRG